MVVNDRWSLNACYLTLERRSGLWSLMTGGRLMHAI